MQVLTKEHKLEIIDCELIKMHAEAYLLQNTGRPFMAKVYSIVGLLGERDNLIA